MHPYASDGPGLQNSLTCRHPPAQESSDLRQGRRAHWSGPLPSMQRSQRAQRGPSSAHFTPCVSPRPPASWPHASPAPCSLHTGARGVPRKVLFTGALCPQAPPKTARRRPTRTLAWPTPAHPAIQPLAHRAAPPTHRTPTPPGGGAPVLGALLQQLLVRVGVALVPALAAGRGAA